MARHTNSEAVWNPGGNECPSCGATDEQSIVARPASNTNVERSLPDVVVDCGVCGVRWES